MSRSINNLLNAASEAYYKGKPFMPDPVFDALASTYGYDKVGATPTENKVNHRYQMFSLMKVIDNDKRPFEGGVESPKLDGAAISLLYSDGVLIQGATRGDGEIGEDVTANCYILPTIPNTIKQGGEVQITGEVLTFKTIKNARNYAAGSMRLQDIMEFKSRVQNMIFVAYNIEPYLTETYTEGMALLNSLGFNTVLDFDPELFPTDGLVYRIDDYFDYFAAGHTTHHPKGAYAFKDTSDVEIKETTLKEVIWQVGKSGKVTPVAIFDEVVIEDAKITRATLHNVGFIEEMELMIGDTILVTRAGKIIPKVIGKK